MKKIWLVLGVMAAVGILFMALGFVLGAVPVLTFDRDGVHVDEARQSQVIGAGELTDITDLDVDIASSRVEVMPAAQAGLEIDCGDHVPVTWSQHGGTLRIRQNYDFWSVFSLNFSWREDVIRVYLPESALQSVRVKNASGTVSVNGVSCRMMELTTMSGRVDVANVQTEEFNLHCTSGSGTVAECEAGHMSLTVTSGRIRASGLKTEGMSAVLTSGSMELKGAFAGDTSFDVTSGSCVVEVEGKLQDYSHSVRVTSGSVRINDARIADGVSYVDSAAPHSLRVKVTSGSTKIRFTED